MGEYLTADRDNALAGGVFNSRNLQTYHYGGNNPLKYTDPNGRSLKINEKGRMYVDLTPRTPNSNAGEDQQQQQGEQQQQQAENPQPPEPSPTQDNEQPNYDRDLDAERRQARGSFWLGVGLGVVGVIMSAFPATVGGGVPIAIIGITHAASSTLLSESIADEQRRRDRAESERQRIADQEENERRLAELEERIKALEGNNNGETDNNSGGAESNGEA